jgi:hypothetical protein
MMGTHQLGKFKCHHGATGRWRKHIWDAKLLTTQQQGQAKLGSSQPSTTADVGVGYTLWWTNIAMENGYL